MKKEAMKVEEKKRRKIKVETVQIRKHLAMPRDFWLSQLGAATNTK
jgi:hypothetical protein